MDKRPGMPSRTGDEELFNDRPLRPESKPQTPSNFSNTSRGSAVNQQDDKDLAIKIDLKKFAENPAGNLGWLAWKIVFWSFILAAVTGSAVDIDSVWSFMNPAVWGSLPGKMAGNAVRNIDETVVSPINESVRESQGRRVSVSTEDGQLEDEVSGQ